MTLELKGRYRLVNDTHLRERANQKDDPRHAFYEAILLSLTYEDYFARVGGLKVQPDTYKTRPVNAAMEIKYCRDNGWVIDA